MKCLNFCAIWTTLLNPKSTLSECLAVSSLLRMVQQPASYHSDMGPSQRLHFCLFHFIVDLWYLYNYEEQYCLYHAFRVSETLQDNKLFIKPYQRHNYCVPWFPGLDVGLNHVGLISQKKSASFLRVRERKWKGELTFGKNKRSLGCSGYYHQKP